MDGTPFPLPRGFSPARESAARVSRFAVRGVAIPFGVAAIVAVVMTWPLALHLDRIARQDADGQFSIWNVAWIAHALTTQPLRVFDANIFYPHHGTLAYSENNLLAGILAIPAWVLTHNAFAAHNAAVLLAFTLSGAGMFFLAVQLFDDRRAAAVSAVCFAFCPYVFSHMAHIELLMTAGLPWSMLAFHRHAAAPSARHGALLGVAIAAQALACGYYGAFVVLMMALTTVVTIAMRSRPTPRAFWRGLALAATIALFATVPPFLPYLAVLRTGWGRTLVDARFYSPNWSAYLASSAYAHGWLLRIIPPWKNEVAFPGFLALALGAVGVVACAKRIPIVASRTLTASASRSRERELLAVYGAVTLLAFWASFGPGAGLYTVLFYLFPLMRLLRAPGRFAIVVALGTAVFAGAGTKALCRSRRISRVAWVFPVAALLELATALNLPLTGPFDPVYHVLAAQPDGAVIEMPFFYPAVGLFQHSKYMVASTTHWKPLVNGYSDYIPPDFLEDVNTLAPFPSRDAFKILEASRPRYAVFHLYGYNEENRRDVLARLTEFAGCLRLIYQDDSSRLYEIVHFPP